MIDLHGDGSLWQEKTDEKGNKYYELVQESEQSARSRLLVSIDNPDSPLYGLTIDEVLTRWRNGEQI